MEKWFQLIDNLEDRRDRAFFADEYDSCIKPYCLKVGKIVSNWSKAELKCSEKKYDGKLDSVLGNVAGIPVFSQELKLALKATKIALNDVQWLPVSVINYKGKTHEGYSIANVTTRISALNRSRCIGLMTDEDEIDPYTKKYHVMGMIKAALKSKVIKGHDIIRLTEFFPPIYVSERFKKLYEKKRFTGSLFQEVIVT